MFKFNDTNILTGYIKEMLASFNLPCYKVYTRQQREHFEKTGEELNVIASQEASKASKEANGATMYIFRRGLDNIYRNCKPCPACMKMIKDYGIKRVVYTIENGIKEMNV